MESARKRAASTPTETPNDLNVAVASREWKGGLALFDCNGLIFSNAIITVRSRRQRGMTRYIQCDAKEFMCAYVSRLSGSEVQRYLERLRF